MERNIIRSFVLDRETDRMLTSISRRYEDNKSLAVRELIRQAAKQDSRLARSTDWPGRPDPQ